MSSIAHSMASDDESQSSKDKGSPPPEVPPPTEEDQTPPAEEPAPAPAAEPEPEPIIVPEEPKEQKPRVCYDRQTCMDIGQKPECQVKPTVLDLSDVCLREIDKSVSLEVDINLKPQWGRGNNTAAGRTLGLAFGKGSLGSPTGPTPPIYSKLIDHGPTPDPPDTMSRRSMEGIGKGRTDRFGADRDGKPGGWRSGDHFSRDLDDRGKPLERTPFANDVPPVREPRAADAKPRWERTAERAPLHEPKAERADSWRVGGGATAAPRARWDDAMQRRRPENESGGLASAGGSNVGPDLWAEEADRARAPPSSTRGGRPQMTMQEMEREHQEFREKARLDRANKGRAGQETESTALIEMDMDLLMDDEQRAQKYGNGAVAAAPTQPAPKGIQLSFMQLAQAANKAGGEGAAPAPAKPMSVEELERKLQGGTLTLPGTGGPAAAGPPPGMQQAPGMPPRPPAPPGFQGDVQASQALMGLLKKNLNAQQAAAAAGQAQAGAAPAGGAGGLALAPGTSGAGGAGGQQAGGAGQAPGTGGGGGDAAGGKQAGAGLGGLFAMGGAMGGAFGASAGQDMETLQKLKALWGESSESGAGGANNQGAAKAQQAAGAPPGVGAGGGQQGAGGQSGAPGGSLQMLLQQLAAQAPNGGARPAANTAADAARNAMNARAGVLDGPGAGAGTGTTPPDALMALLGGARPNPQQQQQPQPGMFGQQQQQAQWGQPPPHVQQQQQLQQQQQQQARPPGLPPGIQLQQPGGMQPQQQGTQNALLQLLQQGRPQAPMQQQQMQQQAAQQQQQAAQQQWAGAGAGRPPPGLPVAAPGMMDFQAWMQQQQRQQQQQQQSMQQQQGFPGQAAGQAMQGANAQGFNFRTQARDEWSMGNVNQMQPPAQPQGGQNPLLALLGQAHAAQANVGGPPAPHTPHLHPGQGMRVSDDGLRGHQMHQQAVRLPGAGGGPAPNADMARLLASLQGGNLGRPTAAPVAGLNSELERLLMAQTQR